MTVINQTAQWSALADHHAQIEAMFTGQRINVTENRSVLHVALRMPPGASLTVDGVDVVTDVHATLDRMCAFVSRVRAGDWRGATGLRIRTVINIGIGGSDLGPAMADAHPVPESEHVPRVEVGRYPGNQRPARHRLLLANRISDELDPAGAPPTDHDTSTLAMIGRARGSHRQAGGSA